MRINFEGIFRQDGIEILGGVICRGIATLYYEQGFPLSASAEFARDNDLKIQWLNVARQLKQQGFSTEKVLSEFKELLQNHPAECDLKEIESFCNLGDEEQKAELWRFWEEYLIVE